MDLIGEVDADQANLEEDEEENKCDATSLVTEDLGELSQSMKKRESSALKVKETELIPYEAKLPSEQRSRSAEEGKKSSVDLTDSSMSG